ncbi:MAG: flagellar protein FlaG [Spirochaetia bacterium]|jgi:flagellar protein FlaG|nr:flagellar protein FlaG [Spirochaetia bacterium]
MDIDVQKIQELTPVKVELSTDLQKEQVKVELQRKADQQNKQNMALANENKRKAKSRAVTDQYMKQVLKISNVLDRELSYSVNKELNQVVVKVIDSKTDKVIRVIPSEALLKLHSRMKEVIGLIFDEEI